MTQHRCATCRRDAGVQVSLVPNVNPHQRASGRTTRMLQAALLQSKTTPVLIVVRNFHQRQELYTRLNAMRDEQPPTHSIRFETWEGHRRPHTRHEPPSMIFYDHFALECELSWMLTELHRFDK